MTNPTYENHQIWKTIRGFHKLEGIGNVALLHVTVVAPLSVYSIFRALGFDSGESMHTRNSQEWFEELLFGTKQLKQKSG